MLVEFYAREIVTQQQQSQPQVGLREGSQSDGMYMRDTRQPEVRQTSTPP